MIGWELSVLDTIQNWFSCPLMDRLMPKITLLGEYGAVCIALALVLLCIPKTRKLGLSVGIALLLGLIVINGVLKPLIFRARPFTYNDFALLIPPLTDGSFPSGHAACWFETAAALWMHKRWAGYVALIPAVLVSFSRLYLYVHFPTDVLTGVLIGIVLGVIGALLTNKIFGWIQNRKTAK